MSMQYLKCYLFNKYSRTRKIYSLSEIKNNSFDFVKEYPVILSTTYSSRNTFSDEFKFDYIIMDEASQIDVVTGTLALSSAKYSVVIGDDKQLPNVEVSTVHKFQGREKDTIIISTVDDEITDFVANSNILNVAISRAKNKLIFIVTGNEIKNKNIKDFIDYVEYNNMEIEDSKIYSVFDLLYKQNELERLKFFKRHNRISEYDSENMIYYLIDEVVKKYDNLGFIFQQPMPTLIKDKSLLNDKEKKYASHYATHIDFLIYSLINKKPVLAIEVDGYKFHKEGTKQHERDLMKNEILKKYNIPLVRLKTNGSREKEVICNELNKIYNIK